MSIASQRQIAKNIHQIKKFLSVCFVYIRQKNAEEILEVWLPDENAMNCGPICKNENERGFLRKPELICAALVNLWFAEGYEI